MTELAKRPLVQAGMDAGTRLRESGVELVSRTREASALLGIETRDATRTWVGSTRAASLDFVATVRSELEGLLASVRAGAELPEVALPELPETPESLEQATARLQLELLVRLKRTLGALDGRLQERLASLESAPRVATPSGKARAPFKGYDAMTAKEIVAALSDASAKKRAAVAAYESAHKKRATVLRAAKRAA